MIIAIAMNVSDHTALKKSYLLYVNFTYSARTFKDYLVVSIPLVLNPKFWDL